MKDSSSINESSSGDSQRLWLRWAMTNFIGFTLTWRLHSSLAHGLTGDHDDYLTQTQKGRYWGKEISGRYRFISMYVRRDGRWRCVAQHASSAGPIREI